MHAFSWSFSAGNAFETCPRKRYWGVYAAWGGWRADAPPLARTAYRLGKMDSRHTLLGHVAEETACWLRREYATGRTPTAEEAYETVARPRLNQAWKDSKSGAWREDPKRRTCLHEHYYPQLHPDLDPQWPQTLRDAVVRCAGHFIATVWPRLAARPAGEEIPVEQPDAFELDGITVYAVPDYVVRADGLWHIHDWKAGRPQEAHRRQLAIYALWAHAKHGAPPDRIRLYAEYLDLGQAAQESGSDELLDETRAAIAGSVMDMADYLDGGDLKKNQPRPREEWDMTPDRRICSRCPFHELCAPELDAG
jgi:hypothetical protein